MRPLASTLLRVAAVSAGVITIVSIAHPGFWLATGIIAASLIATVVVSLAQHPQKTGYR